MKNYKVRFQFQLYIIILLVGLMLIPSVLSYASAWRDAPPITLYDLSGQKISFEVSDEMAVLLFLSSDCFACDRELFLANQLQKDLQFELIPVCVGCDWKEIKRILESLNINLSVYMGSQDLKARWGIWEFPTAFLVDQSMKIVEKWQGKIAVESLEKEIINNILAKTERKKAGSKTSPPACSNGVCY